MNPSRLAPVLAAIVLVTAAAPARPAQAAYDGATSVVGQILLLGAVATTSAMGIVTDVGVAGSLLSSGHVPLVLSLGGTVLWVATSALYVTLLVVDSEFTPVTWNPGTVTAGLICTGSLALSIYGITRGPPPVAVAPAAFRGPRGGLVPGAVLSLRW